MTLPVEEIVDDLLAALREAPAVILNAPAGAGKSTGLPIPLLQRAGLPGRIILLEPRRLAALSVAHRLASLLHEAPGETIGYRMRSAQCCSAATRLEVVTDGILTRQLQRDPALEKVSLVIIDEFHERRLQTDLALALLRDVQQALRPDLKLLVMSATLDDARLRDYLRDAPVIRSAGRCYPVERRYVTPDRQLTPVQQIARLIRQIVAQEPGNMLVFLPGRREIRQVQTLLAGQLPAETHLTVLHGSLTLAAQQEAIAPVPPGQRKIVLATNIAETSLTIDGIRLVVDSGWERTARFDPRSGITRLLTQRISQAAMVQRAGRAGRQQPGICWHVMSQAEAERQPAFDAAEIQHSDLAALQLDVLAWGCREREQLPWLDAPPLPAWQRARQLLQQLGALDEAGRLTAYGQRMAQTGCEPRHAAMLVQANQLGSAALNTAVRLVALLEDPPHGTSCDLRPLLAALTASQQKRARQLLRRMQGQPDTPDSAVIPLLLFNGWPDRLARQRGAPGQYLLAGGSGAWLPENEAPGCADWLVAPQLLWQENQRAARILLACPLDINALIAAQPACVTTSTSLQWQADNGALTVWAERKIGALTLSKTALERPDSDAFAQALLDLLRSQGLAILPGWETAAEPLLARVQCAAAWLPEYAWPDCRTETLLATLESWLLPWLAGVNSMKALQSLDVTAALKQRAEPAVWQRLDKWLPTFYRLPAGGRAPIRYQPDQPPVLAVRVQALYGEKRTPAIADGRIPLLLELLSPAGRPIQITRDLPGFWQGAWREARKAMKGRYPKHDWPEDPAQAQPPPGRTARR